jgi:PHD/YefM family antitoxin component YafN of YafNO toxin-antitoxin module
MQAIFINATELRTRIREIMLGVKFKSERYVIQNFGQPMAIIISLEEYKDLLAQASTPTISSVEAKAPEAQSLTPS